MQILYVNNLYELINTSFKGTRNAICWKRELKGDFEEIVNKINANENLFEIEIQDLLDLELTSDGNIARTTLIEDLNFLKEQGLSPSLNIIQSYQKDENALVFPTDVYSFHVDRSPIETSTILCTYFGEASEILPNKEAIQKIQIPEIRLKFKEEYSLLDAELENFFKENYFDLHYQAIPNAHPINMQKGNIWRISVDFPHSPSLPCIHRAPYENIGQKRLLLIC
jgi:hypothetical protein